jgi:hypothetical protein
VTIIMVVPVPARTKVDLEMAQQKVGAAYGFTAFAVIVLLTLGAMEVLNGMTAIANSNAQVYLNTGDTTYFLHLNPKGWGITHTLLGIALVAVGFGLVAGKGWARGASIGVAAVAALIGFAFTPIYPIWGVIIIALSVAVIWSLTTFHGDLRK